MTTPDRCLARAEEAERLAALVSYGRDRERLTRQAAEWRARAAELSAMPAAEASAEVEPAPQSPRQLISRLLQKLGRATP